MDLNDYIAFFEAQPTHVDPEVGWSCGAQFSSTRGEDRIAVRVAPDDAEFSFDWWQNEKLRASIRLTSVLRWNLECRPGDEVLRLGVGEEASTFILRLKPFIAIHWATP